MALDTSGMKAGDAIKAIKTADLTELSSAATSEAARPGPKRKSVLAALAQRRSALAGGGVPSETKGKGKGKAKRRSFGRGSRVCYRDGNGGVFNCEVDSVDGEGRAEFVVPFEYPGPQKVRADKGKALGEYEWIADDAPLGIVGA
jgi:hypothetical protein